MALLPRISINCINNNKLNIATNLQLFILSKSTQIDAIDAFTKNLIENKKLKWQIFYTKFNENTKIYAEYDNNEIKNSKIQFNNKNLEKYSRKQKQGENDIHNLKRLNNNKLQINNNFITTLDQQIYQQNNKEININLKELNKLQLDALFEKFCMEENNKYDLNLLLNECLKLKLLPSYEIIEFCLKELSLKGNIQYIDDIIEFCKINCLESNKWILTKISSFKGLSLWKIGKVENALDTLLKGHPNLMELNRNQYKEYELFYWAFKEIINDTFSNKSEAILILLIKTANLIYERYNDIYIISWIWKRCFISEWYSDQKLAKEILKKNKKLLDLVFKR